MAKKLQVKGKKYVGAKVGGLRRLTAADMPRVFGEAISDHIEEMLARQKADGSLEYDPKAPKVYPQQAILPLAFCWAGLDPVGKWKGDVRLAECIGRLGDYLAKWYDAQGKVAFDSYGYLVTGVDQRLTYAWTEALRILREAGGDFAFEAWGDKIFRASRTLMDERLRKLQGLRRFVARVTGTGTNHVCLYLTTVYRAGQVLGKKELCQFALPMARAFAADVHPDGYWDEHSDLLRSGGPTPAYNYLTMGGMGLMAEWTGEAVFKKAAARSAKFHANFCYPDGTYLDLIDERVRTEPTRWPAHTMYDSPRIWGLHVMSWSPECRGSAARHMENWLAATPKGAAVRPETLARFVENYLYWHSGPLGAAPTDNRRHKARMTLPGALFRAGSWALGLACIRATTAEDDAYHENPFALERQKVFSVWHEETGLIIDGSHSKFQPENSTFAAAKDQAHDYFPCGGTITARGGAFSAKAAYKTFYGNVRLEPVDDWTLKITLAIDPAGTNGPFTAAFTMRAMDRKITSRSGQVTELGEEALSLTSAELGGRFTLGPVTISGPKGFVLNWPLSPFNSYALDHVSKPEAWLPRVSVVLTPERPSAEFTLRVKRGAKRGLEDA